MYVCMFVCMYVYTCIPIYMYIYIYLFTYIHMAASRGSSGCLGESLATRAGNSIPKRHAERHVKAGWGSGQALEFRI